MRSSARVILIALVILGAAAGPSFAQTPAPKVTINGLVDFVTTAYWGLGQQSQNGAISPNQPTVDLGNKKHGWYSRERGVFTITGEVGRVKGVWAVELDFQNGASNFNASSQPGSLTTVGPSHTGQSAPFDLDTDVQGAVETKWLYLETPVTGPGSLLSFIPVTTIGRFGGQPFRGHDYKPGILATGDFPGVNLETRWTPSVRSTLTFVQISEQLDRFIAPNQKDSWALLASLEVDVFKGLTIKPTYAYGEWDGGNCGTTNLGTVGWGGYNPNTNCPAVVAGTVAGPGLVGRNIRRHYLGADVRWTMGPFSLQPTFIYLLGEQEVPNRSGVINDVDIRSYIFDTIGGFRTGPLLIEARIMYTPGMDANQDIQNAGGGTIRTYRPINPGTSYMNGWSEIWKSGIDYQSGLLVNRGGMTLRESASFDKYGRIFFGIAADYSLTPALTLTGITNVSWTDTAVDTKGTSAAATGLTPSGITTAGNPFKGGKERYLGNEWVGRLTYRFASNVSFDLALSALITGDALNLQRTPAGFGCDTDGIPTCQSRNVYKASARMRVTF
ncbi:MAG TPA: hypothetical protein VK548_29660 [Candidatus Acidoferrum sp.]|nr:hypothetical protein [Candidatus Acidoferrum sp.]